MAKITVTQEFKQPIEQVFNRLKHHDDLNALFAPLHVIRSQNASIDNPPDGVGSVRKLQLPKIFLTILQEQITIFEENKRIEYTVINNPLIKQHLGQMIFTPSGQNTLVEYSIELQTRFPDMVDHALLIGIKRQIKTGLKRMAFSR